MRDVRRRLVRILRDCSQQRIDRSLIVTGLHGGDSTLVEVSPLLRRRKRHRDHHDCNEEKRFIASLIEARQCGAVGVTERDAQDLILARTMSTVLRIDLPSSGLEKVISYRPGFRSTEPGEDDRSG